MNRKTTSFIIAILITVAFTIPFSGAAAGAALEEVWTIGNANDSYYELSSKVARQWFAEYNAKFGGGFDIKAGKKLKRDEFPGVQAGPWDGWAGGGLYPIRIHFQVRDVAPGGYVLTTGFAGISQSGAALKAEIGGLAETIAVPAGGNEDALGYFVNLKTVSRMFFIPASAVKPGVNTLTLTIESGSWLIYDFIKLEAVKEVSELTLKNFSVSTQPYLVRDGESLAHLLKMDCFALGPDTYTKLTAAVGGKEYSADAAIKAGQCSLSMKIPEQTVSGNVEVRVEAGGKVVARGSATIAPVRHLTITLIPHSHLDIGYPDLQPNIILDQRFYLERALDVIDAGKGAPMKWVAEASWPEWLLMKGIGPVGEYGPAMDAEPLMKIEPKSFWKDTDGMRNVSGLAEISSSAGGDTVNNRRAVDGSPMGWVSRGPAAGAWIELTFSKPHNLDYIAVRNGRERDVANPVKSGRVTLTDPAGKQKTLPLGALKPDRERLVLTLNGGPVVKVRIDVDHAINDAEQIALMEIETWEKSSQAGTFDRLKRAAAAGQVEVTGFYMNFLTQLTPTEWLIRSMLRTNEVARALGTPMRTALLTDVPGFSFALPDVLSGSGIRYFYPALNADHAWPCLDGMPRAFYWDGPGGGRILTYHSFKSYNEGWEIGFTRGADLVEQNLPKFLADLDVEKYPYDILPLRTLGDITDDGPVPEFIPQVVEEWNNRWAYPRVVIGTPAKFFEEFEKKYSAKLPSLKGDWTSYWEDGEGSTAMETIFARETHHNMNFASAFGAAYRQAAGKPLPAEPLVKQTEEYVYLYDEHTWGADMSVRSPDNPQTLGQWNFKKWPAWEMKKLTAALNDQKSPLMGPLVSRYAPKPAHGGKIFAAMNFSGRPRSGYVSFSTGLDTAGQWTVYDATGGAGAPAVSVKAADGKEKILYWVKDAPAMGIRYYEVVKTGAGGGSKTAAGGAAGKLQNGYYVITVDEKTGRITSIVDRQTAKELVDGADGYAMNEFIYVKGVENKNQVRLSNVSVRRGEENDVYSELIISGDAPNFPKVEQVIRLYRTEKKIEFENRLKKDETLDKEGLYFAFPIKAPGGEVRLEVTGGVMALEKDQLAGASRDWISIQDVLGVVTADSTVLLSTPDAPLIVPEAIRVLTFQRKLELKNTTVFSYAMNNYWHTNYKAAQGGEFVFRYAMTSGKGRALDSEIIQFGQDYAAPLRTVPVVESGKGTSWSYSFFSIDQKNVRLLGVKTSEDGKGIIVRLQEMDGRGTKARIRVSPDLKFKSASMTNLVEDKLETLPVAQDGGRFSVDAKIRAHGLATIKFE